MGDMNVLALFLWFLAWPKQSTGQTSINHISPPSLSIQKDVYRISVDETLTIRCWGNQSLEWTWLKDKTVTDSHITVNDCIHQSPFCKMLTLSKATANDTGSYQCSYQDSESMNNATSASIYIYVEDPRSPFVTSPVSNHPEVVYIVDNSTAVIPCVGSMADLNVTLIVRYPEKEFIADSKTMYWDSKTGFTIPGNLIKYAGYAFCKTRIDGESHVSSLYIVAVVGSKIYSLNLNPYPQVELTERATLTLECIAEAELNVRVQFVWNYNAQKLLPDGRVTFKAHRHAFSQCLKLSSTLILVNITTKDSGNYSCTVDSARMTLSKSTHVLIYDQTSMNHILPPTLSIQKDVYRISVNETLTIRCWGNQSLEWTWLKDKTVTDSHITVNDCIHQSPFCKMLTLSKAMANDTGSYQCSYQDSESMNNATSATIYVYVEDPRSPFVTSPVSNHPEVVYIGDNNTTLIRCVGSMADLNVTLIARYPEKEFIADGKTMHWDSKTGFTIPGNLIKYAGYVFCKTRIDGESHVSSLYIVAVVGYMMYSLNLNPYPQVELTERATLTVECLAETELNVGVKFVWHYNAQELLPDGRVTFKAHRHTFSPRLKLSSTLILVNITTKDSGNYSCTVDSGRMTLSKSTRVLIYEKTFIAMEPGMGLEYEVNAGQSIKIPVKFKSYPKPEVKWYKNGEILKHNYRITTGYTLFISDLNEEDSGVYEVILTNPVTKEKHPHQYNLVVNVPPRILENALSLPRDYFEYGSEQKLTCTIDAVPAPETIQWQWLSEEDCPIGDKKRDFGKVPKQHNCKGWKNISDSSGGNQIKKYEALQNRVNKYKIRTTSTLEIQAANTSAFYRCLARNKAGEDERMIFFQVTWGLDIHVFPVGNPIESENVVLQCTTKKKRYVNLTWYKLSSNTSHCQHGMKQCQECKNPDDFHKLSSIDCDTDYANVSLQLRFQNISLQDQGMYVCMARNQKTNEIQCLSKYVLVQERMPPAVIGLQHASVNASETLEITCNVSGVPTPRITWFKNNQTVLKDSGVVFLESNQTLTIQRVKKEDSGVYTCLACNDLGCSWTEATISVQDSEVKTNNELILLICAAVFSLFLWLLLVILFRIVKRSTRKDVKTGYLSIIMDPDELPLGDHSDQLSYDAQKWEFPRDRLRLGKPLGRGAFGQVVEATAFGIDKSSTCKTVAVKMLKEGATSSEHRALLSELKILIHIGHHLNVVNLLGACTKPGGPLMVIVEYCKNGNLSNYLRGKRDEFVSYKTKPLKPRHIKDKYTDYILWQMKCRLDSIASSHSSASSGFLEERSISEADEEAGEDPCKNLLTMEDLISYSFQVARGMDFLASRKCIHRDLAARNILLSESNIVKICDFGLARDIYKDPDYVRKGDARLPLKWMAPETIFDRVYTTQSDVWSFGVLLWEIFSLGASPYPGVPIDENFCRRLKEGTRMKMPDYASPEIYQTMLCCWHDEPKLRPTFSELVDHLGNLLQAYAQQDGKDYIPLTMTQNVEDDSGVSLQTSPVSCMEEGESCEPMFHYVNGIPNRNYLQSAKGPSRPVSIKTFDSVPVELPETILQEDNMTDSGMILSNDELQMLENRIIQQSIPLSNIDSSKSKDSLTSETSTQTSDYQSGYHSDDMGAATNTADEKELLLGVQVSQSYHVPSVNYDTAVQYSTHID